MLRNCGFPGIFLPHIGADFRAGDFDWSPFSVVGCGRYDQTSVFRTVRQEFFESTRFLLHEIIRSGYRRICMGLLKHELPILDDFARLAAARISISPGGIPTHVFFSDPDGGLSSFIDWVEAKKADAAIGFSIGHYNALVNAGIRIPRDVRFATLHHYTERAGLRTSG